MAEKTPTYLKGVKLADGTTATFGEVRYSEEQKLTEEQKDRARENIGAASVDQVGNIERTFVKTVNGVAPDENGNVVVSGGNADQPTEYFLLKSPNGTVYKVTVTDGGVLQVVGETDIDLPDLIPGRLLVWNDEFEGTEVDSGKWFFRMDKNQYRNDPTVADSCVIFPVAYDTEKSLWDNWYMLTSGLEDAKYGRFEARMKWDVGQWPAFWLVGQTSQKYNGVTEGIIWPRAGEIDVFEDFGGGSLATTLHYGENEGANIAHDSIRVCTFEDVDVTQWHRYGVEWTENEMVFYIDDTEMGRVDTSEIVYEDGTKPFTKPFYIVVTTGSSNQSVEGNTYYCYTDWVRYYAPADITAEIPIQSISLNESSISLNPGRTRELELTIQPDYVTDYTMRWYSTDRNIAKFNAGNRIETLKAGNVELSVVTKDGLTAKCDLVVSESVINPATKILLDYGATNVGYVGGSITVTATVKPKWATYLDCNWESSNTAVATVENGVISFVGGGNVTITARAKDNSGVSASVDFICQATATDNINTDGCVVKFTRNGWTNSDTQVIWDSDIDTVSAMTGSGLPNAAGNHFEYSQGEGYYFDSYTSPSEHNYALVDLDTSGSFTIAERVFLKQGWTPTNGTPIVTMFDYDAISATTGTTTANPCLIIGMMKTGKHIVRFYNTAGTACINQYDKAPVMVTVDDTNTVVEDTAVNLVFTHSDTGAWAFYVNGTLFNSGTEALDKIENPVLCVGNYPAKVRQNGELCLYQALLAYNKALTADEVTALNTALDEMYA